MKKAALLMLLVSTLVIFGITKTSLADCDMMAIITLDGNTVFEIPIGQGDYDDPADYFLFLKNRSTNTGNKVNDDGYGVIYYPADGSFYYNPAFPADPDNQAWYQYFPNNESYYTDDEGEEWVVEWQWELDTAQNTIIGPNSSATIVLGHDRQGTGGSGNHPFRFEYDNKVYTFIHNGGIHSIYYPEHNYKENLYNYLLEHDNWFGDHPSNWAPGNPPACNDLIDSEVLFHYIMKFVMDYDGNVPAGVYAALNQTDIDGVNIKEKVETPYQNAYSYGNVINFILSDGDMIYSFRNAPNNDDKHELFLNVIDGEFIAINTWIQPAPNTQLQQFDFVCASTSGAQVVSNYLNTNPIDIIQTLDRSGSMNGFASEGAQDTKIEVLRLAAKNFVQLMVPGIGNQLGLVQFNQDMVEFPPEAEADLAELTTDRTSVLIEDEGTIDSIVAGGLTSIGDGLFESHDQLTGPLGVPGHRRSVLLITDGMENQPLWIEDVQDDLINDEVIVYPLGLGYSTGIDETALINLADATGGDYRITSDNLEFRKFFMEILIYNIDWSVIDDAEGALASDNTVLIPVNLTEDDRLVTFNTFWDGDDGAIDVELISPDGYVVDPCSSVHIRYVNEPRYAFYQIDLPMAGYEPVEWVGPWSLRLTHTGGPNSADYIAAVYTDSQVKLDMALEAQYHLTNENIVLQAYLHKHTKPILGAQVKVTADIPLVGLGNLLHDYPINTSQLDPNLKIKGDPVSLIDQKVKIVSPYLKKGATWFYLYDDGKHKDKLANDGIYGNTFQNTKIQGSYNFSVVASKSSTKGIKGELTRKQFASTYHEVDIDPDYSDILIKPNIIKDGTEYHVSITPRDKTGNYMGPGYPVKAVITTSKGVREEIFKDPDIIGAYETTFVIKSHEIALGVNVKIMVNGRLFMEKLLD